MGRFLWIPTIIFSIPAFFHSSPYLHLAIVFGTVFILGYGLFLFQVFRAFFFPRLDTPYVDFSLSSEVFLSPLIFSMGFVLALFDIMRGRFR